MAKPFLCQSLEKKSFFIRDNWQNDYELMTGAMIYGPRPTFAELMASMEDLERRFKNRE